VFRCVTSDRLVTDTRDANRLPSIIDSGSGA